LRPTSTPSHPARRTRQTLEVLPGDIAERKLWDKYMAAYEDMIRATS
jgi:polyphosphate kinase 2 (PPK2 family)